MDDGLIDGVAAMTKFVNLCIAGARACAWAAGCMGARVGCMAQRCMGACSQQHAGACAAAACSRQRPCSTQPPAPLQHAAASAAAACSREGRSMRPAARPAALP